MSVFLCLCRCHLVVISNRSWYSYAAACRSLHGRHVVVDIHAGRLFDALLWSRESTTSGGHLDADMSHHRARRRAVVTSSVGLLHDVMFVGSLRQLPACNSCRWVTDAFTRKSLSSRRSMLSIEDSTDSSVKRWTMHRVGAVAVW